MYDKSSTGERIMVNMNTQEMDDRVAGLEYQVKFLKKVFYTYMWLVVALQVITIIVYLLK